MVVLRERKALIFRNASLQAECHYFDHKNPLPEGEETEKPRVAKAAAGFSPATLHDLGAGHCLF